MRRKILTLGTALGALLAPASAYAAVVVVDAKANSVIGGTGGANTGLNVTAGETIYINSSLLDLWSAGNGMLQSNANGLVGTLLSVAGDDSGTPPNTLIGLPDRSFPYGNLTAPVGALVGGIDSGSGISYQLLGANTSIAAWSTGSLLLYYWDDFAPDNSGSISVSATVPEPATWALMMAGFGILGFGLRRRNSADARVSFKFA